MKPPNENPLELVSSLLGACSAAADDQGEGRTSRVLENAAATRPCGRAARGAASGEFLHCRHGAGSLPLAALRLQCVGRRRGMKQRNASRISQFEVSRRAGMLPPIWPSSPPARLAACQPGHAGQPARRCAQGSSQRWPSSRGAMPGCVGRSGSRRRRKTTA